MEADKNTIGKTNWRNRFWFYLLVRGILYQGVIFSSLQLIGRYYVIPKYSGTILRDFEFEPQYIIKTFLWQAIFFGLIMGFVFWAQKELSEKRENKQKAANLQNSATDNLQTPDSVN